MKHKDIKKSVCEMMDELEKVATEMGKMCKYAMFALAILVVLHFLDFVSNNDFYVIYLSGVIFGCTLMVCGSLFVLGSVKLFEIMVKHEDS